MAILESDILKRYGGDMATTTTIRVDTETRDLLAARAAEREIPLAALLREIAKELETEAIFAAERTAMAADLKNPVAVAEMEAWDAIDDGVG